MFKLILIITMGGMFSESPVAVSQQEYIMPDKKTCEAAAAFYQQQNVIDRLSWSKDVNGNGTRKNLVTLATCWPNK